MPVRIQVFSLKPLEVSTMGAVYELLPPAAAILSIYSEFLQDLPLGRHVETPKIAPCPLSCKKRPRPS